MEKSGAGKSLNIYLSNLGCARNQVDGELMLGLLEEAGWTVIDDPSQAEVIVVNTCGFIESATQQSIDTILEMASFKEQGACKGLIVAGCVPERYREQLVGELPEVDVFLGTGAYDRIADAARRLASSDSEVCLLPSPDSRPPDDPDAPRKTTLSYSAYLKVAEGCSRKCTYCAIPKLRGRHRSRPLKDIVKEAEKLVAGGARELNLVAQDTTSWGCDFDPPGHPAEILAALSGLSDDIWVRILYGHPDRIDERLIRAMGETAGVLPYFDVPIQHASAKVLKAMGRNHEPDDLLRLFDRIRDLAPEAVLRTTLIVGFPGETRHDVDHLLRFVEKVRFDHLGVFTYSDADDLASHRLSHHVPARTAKRRYDRIMRAQSLISEKNNEKHLDRELDVLIEENPEENVYVGRAWFQAPEVDGVVYVRDWQERFSNRSDCGIGSLVRVKITDAMEYDLIGEPA